MSFTEIERMQYERAMETYSEIKKRRSELSQKDKALFEKLEAVELGRYDVSSDILLMITDVYLNNAISAFNTIFRLGFLQGTKKTLNEVKKEQKNGKKY